MIVQAADGDIEVTELPLRKWTQDYKEWLDGMLKPDKDAKDQTVYVSDYKCGFSPSTAKLVSWECLSLLIHLNRSDIIQLAGRLASCIGLTPSLL